MLALLLIAYLAGVSAYSTGAGVCYVNPDYDGVDTASMPQTQNPNFGTFSATAEDENGAASTTYDATSRTITVASSSTDLIAGILGYFVDAADSNPGSTQTKIGDWEATSLVQVEWSACPVNSSQAFTHMAWSTSQQSVAVSWSFPTPMATQKSIAATSIPLSVTYPFAGKLYWILEEGIYIGNNPTPAQIKAGKNSTDQPAFKSGNSDITANSPNTITISGLPTLSIFQAFYFVELASPPTLSFRAYVVAGNRGDVGNEQFYRTVASDTGNLKLTASATPFDGPVGTVGLLATAAGHAVGPAMLLIALCMWVSSLLV
jgi:hypothetical protein